MKRLQLLSIAIVLLTLSSCQLIGDIFKTGVGVGIFLVVGVIALVIFIFAKIGGGK